MQKLRVAVVGGSLGGLSVANVLQQLNIEVEVFEYFPSSFHNRGGALGNVHIDLIQRIRGMSPNKMPPSISGHGHFYGDLWAYPYQGLPARAVHFGVDRVVNQRILLLGDAAHMASPRTGAGAYTAMVDALVLWEWLQQAMSPEIANQNADESHLTALLKRYNSNTVKRGKDLFIRSRQAAGYFAPTNRTIVSPEALVKVL